MNFTKHIFAILLIVGPLVLFIINIPTEIILTIIAIDITIFIALTQQKQLKTQQIQLKKLEDIGNQTKETTIKLGTESRIREIVNNFFALKDKNKEKKYKLFFPVEYKSKPLPLINQGDFYAIHVVSTRIGEDNIDLQPITKDCKSPGISSEDDAIFICAPHANPALNKIYGIKEITDDKAEKLLESEKWPLEGLGLPCWFVEDHRDDGRNTKKKWITRKIWIYDTKELLKSPAEEYYEETFNLEEGTEFRHTANIQQDYGIFGRVNKNNNQYIIVAGIHQYGTWIVASILSNLLSGKEVDYASIFWSDKDFIAVIWGDFDNTKLTVDSERMGVLKKYIWTKEANKWVRVKHGQQTGQQIDKT